jgi:MFS family permease
VSDAPGGAGPAEPARGTRGRGATRHVGPGFRAFLVLWASQTLSLFGTMVSQFAVNVWLVRDVYPLASQKPQLALALTATGVAMTGPLIFAMPIAGAFADRHDRRRILIVANTVLTALSALLVGLSLTGRLTLAVAVPVLATYALAGSFHSAAFDSSYGRFVDPADLPRASGMMMTSFGLSQLLSPPLAAMLVGLPGLLGGAERLPRWLSNGIPFAFAADGLTFVIAATCAALIRFPPHPVAPSAVRVSLVDDVRAGFRWILTRRPFRWLLSFGSLANLTFAPLILLLPILARHRVAADAAAHHLSFEAVFAMANTAGGLGGVLGGVAVSVVGLRSWSKTAVIAVCLAALGVGEVITGLATHVWSLAFGMFVGELLVAPLNTASFSLWQELTPQHLLARALATRRFIAQSAFPIGTAITGWLAAAVEPWLVVTASGAVLALWSVLQLSSPGFHTLEARMREAAARAD